MGQVFISYSRKDSAFADEVVKELGQHDEEVWIDRNSIPVSKKWWDEIKKGISGSTDFIILMSPYSMASPMCHLEIEYALLLGKPIVPVLRADFERDVCLDAIAKRLADKNETGLKDIWENRQHYHVFDTNYAKLQEINQLSFRESEDFNKCFNILLTVIKTDFDHKEQHAKFEQRAMQWKSYHYDASFLLIDKEFGHANEWLSTAGSKYPAPTDLQREYIVASKKRTQSLRTQRIALRATIFIAIALFASAYVASILLAETLEDVNASKRELNSIQTTATHVANVIETSENKIESLRLASEAETLLNNPSPNYEVAALLAVSALNKSYTDQAHSILVRSYENLLTSQIYTGQDSDTYSAALSPDNKLAVVGGFDKIYLWNVETGEQLRVFEQVMGGVTGIVFRSDSKSFVTSTFDGQVKIWQIDKAQPVKTFQESELPLYSVALSKDDRLSATGTTFGAINVRNLNTGELLHTLNGHTEVVVSLAFNSDGSTLLSGGVDGTVRLWDVVSGQQLKIFLGHNDTISAIAFGSDGKTILSGSNDTSIRLWDIKSGELLKSFEGHSSSISSIALAHDRRHILSGSSDGTLRLWDIQAATTLRVFTGHRGGIVSAMLSSDNAFALSASGDKTLRRWNLNTSVAQNQTTPHFQILRGHNSEVNSVDFSPTGYHILSGGNDNAVRLWDAVTGEIIFNMTGHTDGVTSVAFSPDGKFGLSGSYDETLRLWDLQTGECLEVFSGFSSRVTSVAFSADGSKILGSSWIDGIFVWDIISNTEYVINEFIPYTNSLFEPRTSTVMFGYNNDVFFYSLSPNQRVKYFGLTTSLTDNKSFTNISVDYSGKRLLTVTSDNALHLWNMELEVEENILVGHTDQVTYAEFNPSSTMVVSSSYDGSIYLWDIKEEKLIAKFVGHRGAVSYVAFSYDGKFIVSGSYDGTIIVWHTSYQEFITDTCSHIYLDLDMSERRVYQIDDNESICMNLPTPPSPPPH